MKQFSKQATTLLFAAGMGMAATAWSADSLQDVLKARGNLSQQDLLAAAKTYVPTGKRDEFVTFSSGGQSGQVIVYGVPSMRILKYIGVFTPEPWQGYGFDENSKNVLKQGRIDGKDITWGDTHHPADVRNQRRIRRPVPVHQRQGQSAPAVIDLRDFETKQIVVNPIFKSEHGGAFVTTNTEYVIEAAQYPSPLENKKFFPLEEMNEKYRGGVTYWKFDRKEGRILPASPSPSNCRPTGRICPMPASWPRKAGHSPIPSVPSVTSAASKRAVRRMRPAAPPRTPTTCMSSTGRRRRDWSRPARHQENQRPQRDPDGGRRSRKACRLPDPRAEEPARRRRHSGRQVHHRGRRQARHARFGVQLREDPGGDQGRQVRVQGRLRHSRDQHEGFAAYAGIAGPRPLAYPVRQQALPVAYTSLYVDSQVAKWNYCEGKVLDKISVHYNIGHLMTMEGDSTKPAGKYLVALNKLSIDRFVPVGPLQPQSHQLIDISGDKMQLLYDMPLPLGEPHYAVGSPPTS
jgi:nitrous-oxide reductase